MNKFRLFSKILNIVGYVIVGLLVVFVAFMIISNAKGKIAFIGRYSVIWIKTPSMEPTIPGRSYILVKKASADDIDIGDVIIYKSDDPEISGQYNTHRVTDILNGGAEFVTRGDNNTVDDEYTAAAEKVTGIYIKNLPLLSVFGRVLSSPMGIIITLTSVFALFAAIAIPTMARINKERSKELDDEKQALIREMIELEVQKLKDAEDKKDGG